MAAIGFPEFAVCETPRADLVDELLLYKHRYCWATPPRGIADLGELHNLAAARRLEVIERHPVGADFLLRARFL